MVGRGSGKSNLSMMIMCALSVPYVFLSWLISEMDDMTLHT